MRGCTAHTSHQRAATQPKVVELFSGAGLFGYAFREEGFDLSGAYEQDEIAASTYARNLNAHIKVCDLARFQPKGHADVLIAGPPCQGFSSLGHRDPDDPRNNLGLVIPIWATAVNARVVVVENVAGYINSSPWVRIRAQFERAGYETFSWILSASNLGAAQRRVRSFTVFSKIGRPSVETGCPQKAKTVRHAFRGLPRFPNHKAQHFTLPRTDFALRRIRLVPAGGDVRDIARAAPELVAPSWFLTGGKIIDIWGRMRWDTVGPTIRTGFLNPSRGRFLHPREDRPISFREAARLQSIPDDFHFCGHAEAIARQIGNAVPLELGRAVARGIRQLIM
ncbi:MAG: DNA cytosine methyltransferase [Candidatus Binataceae bacterium]